MANTGGPCHAAQIEDFLTGNVFPTWMMRRAGFKEVTLAEDGSRKETGAWSIGWIKDSSALYSILAAEGTVCEGRDHKLYKVEV